MSSHFIYGLLSIAFLGLVTYAVLRARRRLPVTFRSFDEANAVGAVAVWARQQIKNGDPRRNAINWLNLYFPIPLSIQRISRADIALLAPFIDEFIAGRGPPLNLPAEYDDWRPAALREFKARMQREGFWPGDKK
jgi:hypothetical protein